jgi:hypothetical protein
MYASEYDPLRVILFGIHVDGPLSEVDVDRIVASSMSSNARRACESRRP